MLQINSANNSVKTELTVLLVSFPDVQCVASGNEIYESFSPARVVFTSKVTLTFCVIFSRIARILRCGTRSRGCEQIWISQQWGLHARHWNM